MTYPASIVLAHVEVVIVAQLEASVAELAIAAILRLLRQLQMALQIDRRLILIKLQEFGGQSVETLIEKRCSAWCILFRISMHFLQDQVSQARCVHHVHCQNTYIKGILYRLTIEYRDIADCVRNWRLKTHSI